MLPVQTKRTSMPGMLGDARSRSGLVLTHAVNRLVDWRLPPCRRDPESVMSPSSPKLDPRTPVVVGVGQVEQRVSNAATTCSPTSLLAQAALAAQGDAGTGRLLALDTIAVVRILSWRYRDPAALVAEELGITPRRTIETDEGGNYPQALVNRAAEEIRAGTADAVLIGGAETWRTRSASRAIDHELPWPLQGDDVNPTEAVRNHDQLGHPGEIPAAHVMMPVEIYPLFENAWRAAQGWSIDHHHGPRRRPLGRVQRRGRHQPPRLDPTDLHRRGDPRPTPDNRMVGFPYTKLMCANNAVEQAAAVVVCSVERAIDLGIPTDRWVFPWSGTGAHEHWFVSHRWSLAEAPAIRLAGQAALDLAGVGVDDLSHVDVYSCFPSAVQIARPTRSGSAPTARSRSPAVSRSPAARGTTTSAARSPPWRTGSRRGGVDRARHRQRWLPHQARLRRVLDHAARQRVPHPRRPGRGRRAPLENSPRTTTDP